MKYKLIVAILMVAFVGTGLTFVMSTGQSQITKVQTEDVVFQVKQKAKKGDTVVFSPGCSSFDMFKNYEERGNVFKKLVHEAGGKL